MASYDEGKWPDELTDLAAGMKELAEAEPGYIAAHNYFTGKVEEFFASERIRRMVRKTGTSFRVNVCRKAVTSVTDRLEIAAVTVPDDEGMTRILQRDVWDANELTLEAPMVHEKACTFGDAYLFVWPGDESGTVDIEYSGAASTRAIYDAEHPRRIKYVIKAWETGVGEKKRNRVNLYYADRIEKWITEPGQDGTTPESWAEFRDDPEAGWPLDNPYGQVPVFHFRTSRPYGIPLHQQAYGAQDAINKLIVTMMNASDFHFIPQRAALVDAPQDTETDDDDFSDFGEDDLDTAPVPDADRKHPDLSKMKTGPGSLWIMKNVKDLIQLPPADPDVFLQPADFFLRMMATASDMPLHFYDPGGDQPSGDSRRQSEGTLTKKVDRIEDAFQAEWTKALVFAMKVLGYTVTDVDVRFAPTSVVDDADGWTTAMAKINAGVPVRQVLLEAGYQAEQVDEWLKNTDEQDLTRRIALLAQLAQIAQQLATASSLGALPEALVTSLMAGIMGNATTAETAPAPDVKPNAAEDNPAPEDGQQA